MGSPETLAFRSAAFALMVCAAAILTPIAGLANEYPQRPVRLIHGFAPGGPADTLSRVVADALSAQLKQPVLVEARSGAGGVIGADAVAKAEPDGYTLGLITGGHTVSAAMQPKLPYDAVDSFTMISTVVDYSFVIAGKRDGFSGGLRGLIEEAKANPGKISYGSAGTGTTQHLTGELLASNAGIKLLHVPYRGDAAAVTGLLSDQVQFVIASSVAVLPHVQAGAVRGLAVTTAERWEGLPDVPAVAESGVESFDVRTWAGIVAPRATPPAIALRIQSALVEALSRPEVRERVAGVVAGTVRLRSPEQMGQMIGLETARWRKVITDAAIQTQ